MCIKAVDDYANTLKFVHDWYKTQKMCDKVVHDFLPALKFVPSLIKILVISYFLVMKWVFLV